MNILLISDDFYPNYGGVSYILVNLCILFQKTNHNLYIVNPNIERKNIFKILIKQKINSRNLLQLVFLKKTYFFTLYTFWRILFDKNVKSIERLKISLYFLTKPRLFMRIIKNVGHMYQYLRKINFDVILSGHSGWILPLNYIISRIFQKKLVTIAHGDDFLIRNPLSLKTYFFRNADKIIVTNNVMKQYIKRIHQLNENQLCVIHIGLNPKDFDIKGSKHELRQEFKISKDSFVLLSVGSHVPRKRFDLVIKAIKEIKKANSTLDIRYFLIGEGKTTSKLKNCVKKLNLSESVVFLGRCDTLKRNKFYKLADVFIMPSVEQINSIEGFGIVFLEAGFFKLPVIGSFSGGIIEAVIHKETGLLTVPNDLNNLIKNIMLIYKNKEMRRKMGQNGYNRVLKDFNWDNILKDYITVFRNVLNNQL